MRAVQRTSELDRVLALPRRDPRQNEDLAAALTARLVRPHQCHPECAKVNGRQVLALKPLQATALAEVHDHRGLFLQAPVGTGKTLVTALLRRLLGVERALLLVPAALKGKTVREFKKLAEHWDILFPTIETYSRMSRASTAELLDRFRPELIILDEGHFCKNTRAAVTRRIRRYLREHPEIGCVVVDLTGTGAKRSIRDFAHRMHWCMRERCPVPLHESDLLDWSAAVDEKVPEKSRLDAGALARLIEPGDGAGPEAVRRALGRRIFDTPGALRSSDPGVDVSLYIECRDLPLSAEEDAAFEQLRQAWVTPDGHPIADAVQLWRHARELALGFFMVWDPRPPRAWLQARAEWCAAVRDTLAHNRHGLDTEFQVADEVRTSTGRHALTDVYEAWRGIKDSFVPNSVPVWVGSTALDAAAEWLRSKDGAGIVWTEHVPFAVRLAELARVPYFGAGGKDARGRPIEDCPGEPCVASIASNGTGRNLQAWSRAWVSSCKPTGTIWEQMLGRLHRPNQEADAVEFVVPLSCREVLNGFLQARRDAEFHRDLLEAPARLCIADVDLGEITKRGWSWREQARA